MVRLLLEIQREIRPVLHLIPILPLYLLAVFLHKNSLLLNFYFTNIYAQHAPFFSQKSICQKAAFRSFKTVCKISVKLTPVQTEYIYLDKNWTKKTTYK